jgi:hypothetical protein
MKKAIDFLTGRAKVEFLVGPNRVKGVRTKRIEFCTGCSNIKPH